MGIDTKRCQHCQKVLRADAPRCSLCGYVFSPEVPDKRNGSATNGSRHTVTLTMPSNPPASPHRAGHYSGLHPEDQPFQSSFMPVQRARTITRSLVDQEVVLPTVMAAPAPPPKAPDTEGLLKRRVAVPTPLPLPMPQRSVNSPLGSPQRQFVSPPVTPAPLTNQWFTEPVPAVLPLPRKQQKQSRVVPVLLSFSCLLFLLATSVLAFLLLDKRPVATTTKQAVTHVSHAAPLVPVIAITPSALSFSAIQGTNPAPQPFTISNMGNAPLNWAAAEDENGLAFAPVSPQQGTVAPGKTVTISVKPDVARAPAGVINALITISDTDKGTRVPSQQVAITILNQAVINVSSTTMTFTTTNSTQSLVITNTGSAPLNWTVGQVGQPLPPWLSVDVTSGTLSPGGRETVKVTCDSTDLPVGNHTATLVVSDTDTGTPVVPQDVQVILTVS